MYVLYQYNVYSLQGDLKPKDPAEEKKLQDLKTMAAQWQQQKQTWGTPGKPIV